VNRATVVPLGKARVMEVVHIRAREMKWWYERSVLTEFRTDLLIDYQIGYYPIVGKKDPYLIAGMEWELSTVHLGREIFQLSFRDEYLLLEIEDRSNVGSVITKVVTQSIQRFEQHCLERIKESGLGLEVPGIPSHDQEMAQEGLKKLLASVQL
jgi:hypothetical protein